MLTEERHQMILDLLKEKEIVKIQELVEATNASESTIRRDLTQLEKAKFLKRVHGGATKLKGKLSEPDVKEKSLKNIEAKKAIAKFAAEMIEDEDCIYIDAGTTTLQLIDYLPNDKEIVVVTNGLTHIEPLLTRGIKTYLLGGYVKPRTGALIGRGAMSSIEQYRFDKCFLGVNGIHKELGFTTPDPDEAFIKSKALQLSREGFVLADESKFNEISFSKIANIQEATIITNQSDQDVIAEYAAITDMKVVGT
ncbi:DeoR/GlpR family DNA-binding transcription regulator [Aeribacillus alveayuensis]|uniref:DeoR family fructose operon transcriptional repressor n=1 Tax=Aeribacillus alveayuensis TaxID=279215 RepID=A0ABT9VRU6_9BACI|nr:DeoR family fructose operon transcriptional repressor [Bacillus alveayuensis]